MKFLVLILSVVGVSCCCAADDFDAALDLLIENTASAIVDSSSSKVAVLDFRDFQDTVSPFSRYLAEQTSVGLVIARKGFTVVDRANLKSILEEAKLTEEGLIKPENAKKLGQFSGVDALVVGTLASTPSGHSVTVKIISTEKAEIVGAAKVKLPLNSDFDVLVGGTVPGENKGGGGALTSSPHQSSSSGVTAKFRKLQVLQNGKIEVALDLLGEPDDKSRIPTVNLRLEASLMTGKAALVSSSGREYVYESVSGISLDRNRFNEDYVRLSDQVPVRVSLRFRPSQESAAKVMPGSETFDLTADLNVSYGGSSWDAKPTGIQLTNLR